MGQNKYWQDLAKATDLIINYWNKVNDSNHPSKKRENKKVQPNELVSTGDNQKRRMLKISHVVRVERRVIS